MPLVTNNDWLRRYTQGADYSPTFNIYSADTEPMETAAVLRQAFAFFRRNADRRYSANSLMKMLTYADQLEMQHDSGRDIRQEDFPLVTTAGLAFSYDEETEVKSGGLIAVSILLPDNRVMMAVHPEKRRSRVGVATFRFTAHYIRRPVVVWVHGENEGGAHFCLHMGLRPRSMNASGAVAYSENNIADNDSMAVASVDEYEVEEMLARHHGQQPSQPRARRVTREVAYEQLQPLAVYQDDSVTVRDATADEMAVYYRPSRVRHPQRDDSMEAFARQNSFDRLLRADTRVVEVPDDCDWLGEPTYDPDVDDGGPRPGAETTPERVDVF